MSEREALITLRSPSDRHHELVITVDGQPKVYRLSFEQVRLLALQFLTALLVWPVRER